MQSTERDGGGQRRYRAFPLLNKDINGGCDEILVPPIHEWRRSLFCDPCSPHDKCFQGRGLLPGNKATTIASVHNFWGGRRVLQCVAGGSPAGRRAEVVEAGRTVMRTWYARTSRPRDRAMSQFGGPPPVDRQIPRAPARSAACAGNVATRPGARPSSAS